MKNSASKILFSTAVVFMLILLQVMPAQNASAATEDTTSQPTAEPGVISGVVYDSAGIPIEAALVTVYSLDFQVVAAQPTPANGYFYIVNLAAGDYYVGVQAAGWGGVYYPNGYDNPHAQSVQVISGSQTSGIDFHLTAEASISGHQRSRRLVYRGWACLRFLRGLGQRSRL
jgi:hypothetical protein